MTNAEIIATIRAEIERLQPNAPKPGNMKSVDAKVAMQVHARLNKLLSFLSTLESEHLADDRKTSPKDLEEGKRPMMEDAVKWLVDDDYHEASEKGRFILGSVGLGYNGYYIPYLDLLKLPKED